MVLSQGAVLPGWVQLSPLEEDQRVSLRDGGEGWREMVLHIVEASGTRLPHLHNERAVLNTSQGPPALELWHCLSLKAFTGFLKTLGMSPLGQDSASDLGKGDGSCLVPPRPGERASSLTASRAFLCFGISCFRSWGSLNPAHGGPGNLHFNKPGKWLQSHQR